MTDELKWFTPKEAPFKLAGFAWFAKEQIYRRLPAKPASPLPQAVDSLANCTAGGQIRFQTDSKRVSVRVRLSGPANMCHMPSTGQCGFDCYIGPPRAQRYCGTAKYDHTQLSYECTLFERARTEMCNVTLNFPLYQGVEEVSVGLEPGSAVEPPLPFRGDGCVVAYGTSITQGGCACRPGMAYTNILSRRLNIEFVNLGFSGSGRGEPEVARTIAEVANPACFILDYEANAGGEVLFNTLPEFIRILRAAHRRVPILVVSRIAFAWDAYDEGALRDRIRRRDFQRETVEDLRSKGDRQIFFHDGSEMLGADFDECTVDGVHPTDLGFIRMATALEPVVESILRSIGV